MKKLSRRAFKVVLGKYYNTPKELWGFRTEPGEGPPTAIAWQFLELNRDYLGIPEALGRLVVRRVVHGLSATHVIFQQRWRRRRIHRAYVTVHIDPQRCVYLVKSRAVPDDVLREAKDPRIGAPRAVRAAFARVRHSRGRVWVVGRPELLWFPARRLLHPAWRVRIHRTKPLSFSCTTTSRLQ